MSYFMSCQKCGKETIGRYATENSLCGECISDIDKLSVKKLQEQLNTAKKALTEIADVKRRLEHTTDFGVGFQPTYNALEFVVAESKKAHGNGLRQLNF